MKNVAVISGKIILCGEYAMAFGHPGIAFPSKQTMRVHWSQRKTGGLTVIWAKDNLHPAWASYAGRVADIIGHNAGHRVCGDLTVETDLPLGKGMGSSTALVIGVAKALLGEHCRDEALTAEEEMNPGHSGMDFAVIWEKRPIVFRKGSAVQSIALPDNLLSAMLIDTGMPNETTPELVAWVRSREEELGEPLNTIAHCTQRILAGEDLKHIIRDHHKAQVLLGVVPPHARKIIESFEAKGGAAKVIGAGGRTGGGGMVLALM